MFNVKVQAAAVSEKGGVLVGMFGGRPELIRCVGDVNLPENRDELNKLFWRAARKIGCVADRRFKKGFRKV